MQPRAWETLRCLISSRSINEEPSVKVNYFTKENFQQFNEEDLESIIDENIDSERLQNISVDSVGMQSATSTKVNVDNPLRKFSEGYDL